MKRIAALFTVLSFGVPNTALALPSVVAPDKDKPADEIECYLEPIETEADLAATFQNPGDIEIFVIAEINEETGELIGRVQIITISFSPLGYAMAEMMNQELAGDPLFEVWDCPPPNTGGLWDRSGHIFPMQEEDPPEELLLSFNPTIDRPILCNAPAKQDTPRPTRDEKSCQVPNEPAINNDEVLALMASLQSSPESPETPPSPKTPFKKRVREGLQDSHRRHAMTSRAA